MKRLLDVRIRFWLWLNKLSNDRVSYLYARQGHTRWWRDNSTGFVFLDDEARRASSVSMEGFAAADKDDE